MNAIQTLKQRVLELETDIQETALRIKRREEQTEQDKKFLRDIKTALASCNSAIEKLSSKNVMQVKSCASCGNDHEKVVPVFMEHVPDEGYFTCPVTNYAVKFIRD